MTKRKIYVIMPSLNFKKKKVNPYFICIWSLNISFAMGSPQMYGKT